MVANNASPVAGSTGEGTAAPAKSTSAIFSPNFANASAAVAFIAFTMPSGGREASVGFFADAITLFSASVTTARILLPPRSMPNAVFERIFDISIVVEIVFLCRNF